MNALREQQDVKKMTMFEEYLYIFRRAMPDTPLERVVQSLTDATNEAEAQMCSAETLSKFRECGDVWFNGKMTLFSFYHYQ